MNDNDHEANKKNFEQVPNERRRVYPYQRYSNVIKSESLQTYQNNRGWGRIDQIDIDMYNTESCV